MTMTNSTNGPGQPPQADPGNQPSTTPALDLATHGNTMVTVKVHGQEILVPLSEAVAGYQRTQDYQLKTEALAEERRGFAEKQSRYAQMNEFFAGAAQDPQGAIESLQQTYAEQLHATSSNELGNEGSESPEVVALRQELAAVKNGIEQDRLTTSIEQEKSAVAATFPDLEQDVLLRYAAERQYQTGQLMEAAKAMRHDLLHTRLEQTEQATQAGDQLLAEQKAGLPPIAPGTAAAGAADSAPVPVIGSVEDAISAVLADQATSA